MSLLNVLQDKPGRITTVEHTIDTGTASPVRLPPYRVPHAYRDMVESELKDMLENGIIEPSASPVVCTNGVSAEKRWFPEAVCGLP